MSYIASREALLQMWSPSSTSTGERLLEKTASASIPKGCRQTGRWVLSSLLHTRDASGRAPPATPPIRGKEAGRLMVPGT